MCSGVLFTQDCQWVGFHESGLVSDVLSLKVVQNNQEFPYSYFVKHIPPPPPCSEVYPFTFVNHPLNFDSDHPPQYRQNSLTLLILVSIGRKTLMQSITDHEFIPSKASFSGFPAHTTACRWWIEDLRHSTNTSTSTTTKTNSKTVHSAITPKLIPAITQTSTDSESLFLGH